MAQSFFLMEYALNLRKHFRLYANQYRVSKASLDRVISQDVKEITQDLSEALGTKRGPTRGISVGERDRFA
jgi:hypothetical protein